MIRRLRGPAPAGRCMAVLAWLASAGCATVPESGLGLATGALSDQWTVKWDPVLGTPSLMTNRSLQEGLESGAGRAAGDSTAEAAVRAVFREHADWFRLRPEVDDFHVVRSFTSGWLLNLRLEQRYRGLPVAGAGYDARVLPSGRVGSLEGRFYPEIHIPITPVLDAAQAEERARARISRGLGSLEYLQFETQNGFSDSRLLAIVPRGGTFVLTWGVVVQNPPDGFSRVFVDATSGAILGHQFLGGTWQR